MQYKIIDFTERGNLIRLYLGDVNDNEYWGDDWNDRPYEHNAGTVYDEYIKVVLDIAFNFDHVIMFPSYDWRYNCNSPFSKEDFKNRKAPFVVIHKYTQEEKNSWCYIEYNDYSQYMGDKNSIRLYFNDIVTIEDGKIQLDRLSKSNIEEDYNFWLNTEYKKEQEEESYGN